MRTSTRYDVEKVYGDDMAQMVAWKLVGLSCWYEFTPLPEGWYEFTFKNEPGLRREVERIVVEAANEVQS